MLIDKLKELAVSMPDKTALQSMVEDGYAKISYLKLQKVVLNSASLLAGLSQKIRPAGQFLFCLSTQLEAW